MFGMMLICFGIAVILVPTRSCAELQGSITVFHAGSLSVPFEAMEKDFEAKHPGVDVMREPAGSRKCARKIADVKKLCDIMASADYKVIDELLIPEYATWNVRFATNQIVLSYTDNSKYAREINVNNWYDVLLKEGVVWGHADPNLDPCGYRSLMVMQLAEKYYQKPGLYDSLIDNCPKENIRPKEVELVSLQQTGNMDYAWQYLSVSIQHGLKYLVLPEEINLGNYNYDRLYEQAVVKVSGKEPGTFSEVTGSSCTYGISLIKNAPNEKLAVVFLEYIFNPQGGLKILQETGQPPFMPCRVPTEDMKRSLPPELQCLVEVKN
ncbi:MAG: tungstate ABC transporter substrate-binding protein WtpA [Deltaproteobacteria bacterium]|nr:tungstate ABC transporter substrate-binding protein WtpA [Deltaproteobacteria bacterium]